MCGYFGVLAPTGALCPRERLDRAQTVQRHRGPDSLGEWMGDVGKRSIFLGFQRLAIIDLSSDANQPMIERDGRGVIVFNGEIYNYLELRKELAAAGDTFSTTSDTEVVLAALRRWGAAEAMRRFNGMWSFAWVDVVGRRLVLSRDRTGKKPLYLAQQPDGSLFFGSEIKTLLALAPRRYRLNSRTVGEYLVQSLYEASDETFLDGVVKLPAASWTEIPLDAERIVVDPRRYWEYPSLAQEPPLTPQGLREVFIDAVRIRLRSDVPVGLLLSGGLDSSSIAAAMHLCLGRDASLNLLSAVSDDPRFDESPFIDRVADHLGRPVQKVRLALDARNAVPLLERVTFFNDEPVGSFSNVAHHLLMERARELGVTVILSGQGGDELLCGYKKYVGFALQEMLRRGRAGDALRMVRDFAANESILPQFSLSEARRYLPAFMRGSEGEVLGEALRGHVPVPLGLPWGMRVEERQILDVARFSVPALNHYEDRMSMSCSRENRFPFLDVRLLESLLPLSFSRKIRDGWTKWILRKAMEPLLPPEIVWRRDKQGFVNPQSEWLKKELRPAVLDFFAPESRIFQLGLLRRRPLLAKYEAYCRQPAGGGRIWFREIFAPLALEVWLRTFGESIEGCAP